MDHLAVRYADSWNASWHNRAECLLPRLDATDAACAEVGRDPATLERAAGLMIDLPRSTPQPQWPWGRVIRAPAKPFIGTLSEIVQALWAHHEPGVSHLQLWLDPPSPETIASFGPVVKQLTNRAEP